MTDFNSGFDPSKFNGAQFNANRQGNGKASDAQQAGSEAAPATDRFADQKLSPDRVFDLLNQKAQWNRAAGINHAGIESSIAAFQSLVTPEAHAALTKDVEKTLKDELGIVPNDELVESIVSNLVTGFPLVQPNV